jgi:hypothetical protein
LSSQDEEGGAAQGFGGGGITVFEPIPHDHDFCERVVINVSMKITNYLISILKKNQYDHDELMQKKTK